MSVFHRQQATHFADLSASVFDGGVDLLGLGGHRRLAGIEDDGLFGAVDGEGIGDDLLRGKRRLKPERGLGIGKPLDGVGRILNRVGGFSSCVGG